MASQDTSGINAVVNAQATAFTYDNVTLTAETEGAITSYQWYKSTSSGFTPSSSNIIAGEVNSTLTTTETTADTIYYRVKVNGSINSDPEHNIVWSARSAFTARYQSGTAAVQTACAASGTTIAIFANNSSFTAATKFFTDIQGNTDNFQQGTYSNSTDGTDNDYRFINSDGIPATAIGCETFTVLQPLTATACGDSGLEKNFNVIKANNVADIAVTKVIDFTVTQFGHTHWVVTNANYGGSSFDSSPTLAANGVNNANTCITQDPPTLALTGTTSVLLGKTITLTATPSGSSQGGTYSYQFQRSTDNSSFSSLDGAESGSSSPEVKTTTESSVDTIYYRCVLNGSITSNVVTTNVVAYQSVGLKLTSGADIAAKATACGTATDATLYYDQLTYPSFATVQKLYTSNAGATAGITAGTYSDGSYYGYAEADGDVLSKTVDGVTSRWFECTGANKSVTIVGDTSATTNAVVVLVAVAENYTATSFTWTRTPAGGSISTVQTGASSTYTAAESTALAYTYGVTATDEAGTSETDTHTVTFSTVTQSVTAQLCPAGVTRNVTISNAGGYTVGQVIKLAAASPVAAGSYKITNASYSGSVDATTTVTELQPAGDCCASLGGCSATISRTVNGSASTAGTVAVGATVVLTADAVNYTDSTYVWAKSTDLGTDHATKSYTNVGVTTVAFTPDNSQPAYITYRCTVGGTAGESEIAYHAFSWYAAEPQSRTYDIISYQSNCDPDDAVLLGTWTSIDPLDQNTVVHIDTGICFKTGGYYEGASQPTANGAIVETYGIGASACTTCQTAQTDTSDCTASFDSGTYNFNNGNYSLTGYFGTSYVDADDFNIQTSIGTVSPTTTTVSALKSGLTVTATAGATLTFTARVGTNCVGTAHQTIVPLSTCNAVSVIYTNDNPASSTSAADDLCGGAGGRIKTAYMNGTTLASSTVVYMNNTCSSLLDGPKYITENFSDYYIWNGYTLAGPYAIACP